MNLLAISKKKTVTKLRNDDFVYIPNNKHTAYWGSQNQMTTSHLDIRRLVSSCLSEIKTVNSMSVSDILSDRRN